MAGPKPGGDKQALMDAYGAAKSDAGAGAPDDGGAPPDPNDPTQQDPNADPNALGSDPEMKSLQLQVQHIEHLLVAKGILSPQDLISPPQAAPPMAPPGGMGAPPMGAPPAPGGPPLQ